MRTNLDVKAIQSGRFDLAQEKATAIHHVAAHALQFSSAAAYVAALRKMLGNTPHAFRQDGELE